MNDIDKTNDSVWKKYVDVVEVGRCGGHRGGYWMCGHYLAAIAEGVVSPAAWTELCGLITPYAVPDLIDTSPVRAQVVDWLERHLLDFVEIIPIAKQGTVFAEGFIRGVAGDIHHEDWKRRNPDLVREWNLETDATCQSSLSSLHPIEGDNFTTTPIGEADRRLKEFQSAFDATQCEVMAQAVAAGGDVTVQTAFQADRGSEAMWVHVDCVDLRSRVVSGVLANYPLWAKDVAFGQRVFVRFEDICDIEIVRSIAPEVVTAETTE